MNLKQLQDYLNNTRISDNDKTFNRFLEFTKPNYGLGKWFKNKIVLMQVVEILEH